MAMDRDQVLSVLSSWAKLCARKGYVETIFAFGSLIYKGGGQLMLDKSDIDLVIQLPTSAVLPEDRLVRLQEIFECLSTLEPKLLPLLKWSNASDPIVSVVAVTSFELIHGIHKSKQSNFFSSSDFIDLLLPERPQRPLLTHDAAQFYAQHKAAVSVVCAAQSYRNEYLSISANGTRSASSWDSSDLIPKAVAREAAQLRYFIRQTDQESQFDINRGTMFILEELDKYREQTGGKAISSLCDSVMARSGGRGERLPLTPEHQMLLWEVLWQVSVDTIGKRNAAKTTPPKRRSAVLRLTHQGWVVKHERESAAFVAEAKWNIAQRIGNPFTVVVEKDPELRKLEARSRLGPGGAIKRFDLQKREQQLTRIRDVIEKTIHVLMNSEALIRSVPSLESNLDSNVAAIKSALRIFEPGDVDAKSFAIVHRSHRFDTRFYLSKSDIVDIEKWFMRPAHAILVIDQDDENLSVSRFPDSIKSKAVGRIIYVLIDHYDRDLMGADKDLVNMNNWYVGVA